eukprot:7099925-Alexandrium_andersonii.AAC.1
MAHSGAIQQLVDEGRKQAEQAQAQQAELVNAAAALQAIRQETAAALETSRTEARRSAADLTRQLRAVYDQLMDNLQAQAGAVPQPPGLQHPTPQPAAAVGSTGPGGAALSPSKPCPSSATAVGPT